MVRKSCQHRCMIINDVQVVQSIVGINEFQEFKFHQHTNYVRHVPATM